MITSDPFLSKASITWTTGVDIEKATTAMIELLSELASQLECSSEQFAPECAKQTRDQIVIFEHFLRRIQTFIDGCQYASDGLCQEFYRMGGLHEDFDRFDSTQLNDLIERIVRAGNDALVIDRKIDLST